jgi:hypothetical protein
MCKICHNIFRGNLREKYFPPPDSLVHHEIYKSLKLSKQGGCFICATVWYRISYQLQINPSDGIDEDLFPTKYMFERKFETENGLGDEDVEAAHNFR